MLCDLRTDALVASRELIRCYYRPARNVIIYFSSCVCERPVCPYVSAPRRAFECMGCEQLQSQIVAIFFGSYYYFFLNTGLNLVLPRRTSYKTTKIFSLTWSCEQKMASLWTFHQEVTHDKEKMLTRLDNISKWF